MVIQCKEVQLSFSLKLHPYCFSLTFISSLYEQIELELSISLSLVFLFVLFFLVVCFTALENQRHKAFIPECLGRFFMSLKWQEIWVLTWQYSELWNIPLLFDHISIYLRGRDWEDQGSRPTLSKKFESYHLSQWLDMVAHTCHPGYMGKHKREDGDQANLGQKWSVQKRLSHLFGRITVRAQPRQIVCENTSWDPISKKGLVEWLKV
jgi:hypothetical protein